MGRDVIEEIILLIIDTTIFCGQSFAVKILKPLSTLGGLEKGYTNEKALKRFVSASFH